MSDEPVYTTSSAMGGGLWLDVRFNKTLGSLYYGWLEARIRWARPVPPSEESLWTPVIDMSRNLVTGDLRFKVPHFRTHWTHLKSQHDAFVEEQYNSTPEGLPGRLIIKYVDRVSGTERWSVYDHTPMDYIKVRDGGSFTAKYQPHFVTKKELEASVIGEISHHEQDDDIPDILRIEYYEKGKDGRGGKGQRIMYQRCPTRVFSEVNLTGVTERCTQPLDAVEEAKWPHHNLYHEWAIVREHPDFVVVGVPKFTNLGMRAWATIIAEFGQYMLSECNMVLVAGPALGMNDVTEFVFRRI